MCKTCNFERDPRVLGKRIWLIGDRVGAWLTRLEELAGRLAEGVGSSMNTVTSRSKQDELSILR